MNTTGSPNNEKMLTEIRAGSTSASRKTWQTSAFGRLSLLKPSMSCEGPAFSALLDSVNGKEAQPARVDAAVINNVPPSTQADFAFNAFGIRIRASASTLTPLYASVRLEVKSIHGPWVPLGPALVAMFLIDSTSTVQPSRDLASTAGVPRRPAASRRAACAPAANPPPSAARNHAPAATDRSAIPPWLRCPAHRR